MADERMDADRRDCVVASLLELIDAIDRRVPQVQRVGELAIAAAAAALRQEALARIEELNGARLPGETRDVALANAIMSDDGSPTIKAGSRPPTGVADV
jgi:hypothetical protein